MKGLCWKTESRTFLLPTHNAEAMMYSNCPPKGNLSLVILPSLGTKGFGLWDILSDQLRHRSSPSSYIRAMAWDCHKKAMKAELEAAPWHPLELKVLQHPSCSPQHHGQQILAASASWDALSCLAVPRTRGNLHRGLAQTQLMPQLLVRQIMGS